MINARDLKKQILSIKAIAKITKAMELVATAKLKKISQKMKTSRKYFHEIYDILHGIISELDHSLYQVNTEHFQPQHPLCIVIASNFGLCGGYNVNVEHKIRAFVQQQKNMEVIAVGSKLNHFFQKLQINVKANYTFTDDKFSFNDARGIMAEILAWYNQKHIDAISVVYTKFVNNVTFEPIILPLLPMTKTPSSFQSRHQNALMEFDPSPEVVLENSLPLYLNTVFYACVFESFLSEQASRRNAMQNANQNADDMISDLSLKYHRLRQSGITQEIMEIIAGAGQKEE